MRNTKPLVALAVICEHILEEKDGVVSAIRLVDTFGVAEPPEWPAALNLNLLVSLKSGDLTGKHEVGLVLRTPSGRPLEVRKQPVVFNGGEHGVNLKIRFTLTFREGGLYWFDVMFGDDVLTSIPLKLRVEPASGPVH